MNGVVTVIPAYNEARTLRGVVVGVLRHCPQVIVVDDGSTDSTAASVADLPITLVRNPRNLGKAASLWAGMRAVLRHGASAVITLDADGQHRPEDIPRFLALAQAHPREIDLDPGRAAGVSKLVLADSGPLRGQCPSQPFPRGQGHRAHYPNGGS